MRCLQDNFDRLSNECHSSLANWTEMESEVSVESYNTISLYCVYHSNILCVCVCVCVCVRARVCACVRACACVCINYFKYVCRI